MTVVRHNRHAGLRLEFRPADREPWAVADRRGARIAVTARKQDALAHYRLACELARRGLGCLPFHAPAAEPSP